MILALEVVGPQAAALGLNARKEFGMKGGTIGRSPDNDWVIADSYISGVHARIHYRNGRFFIVDSSANGTSLKTRANRLTKGQWYAIDDQDRVFLDVIELSVRVRGVGNQPVLPSSEGHAHPVTQVLQPSGAAVPPAAEEVARTTPLAMPPDAVLSALIGDRDLSVYGRDLLSGDGPEAALESPVTESFNAAFASPSAQPNAAMFERTTAMPPSDSTHNEVPARTVAMNLEGPAVQVEPQFADVFDGGATRASEHAPGLLDTQMVKTLLAGASIPTSTVTPELADTLSQVLRQCLQGLLELQQQRDTVKDAFHLSVTKFKPAENNPLRFSANVEDALYNLLVKRNPAYLPPAEAVTQSFRDVQAHEAAMVSAMRTAFFDMLKQFDPQRFASEEKRGGFFAAKKSGDWDKYRQHYGALRQQPDGGFSELFGDAFARAYQEALDRLKNTRI